MLDPENEAYVRDLAVQCTRSFSDQVNWVLTAARAARVHRTEAPEIEIK